MGKVEHHIGPHQTAMFAVWHQQFDKWQQRVRDIQQQCFRMSADIPDNEAEELSDALYEAALRLTDAEKALDLAKESALKMSFQEHGRLHRT